MGLICYFYTLQEMPLGNATITHYLAPVLRFAGVVLVTGAGFQVPVIPMLAGSGGAFFSALAFNTIKKLKVIEDPNLVVLYFPLVSVPIALFYFLFKPGE